MLTVRSHVDAKLLMHLLGSAVVVVFLVYVGIFAIFVSINGRAKLPTVKFQQILWFPGYASVFEISWFITNSFPFFIFLSSTLLAGNVSPNFAFYSMVSFKSTRNLPSDSLRILQQN
jgi:hypothetical protein